MPSNKKAKSYTKIQEIKIDIDKDEDGIVDKSVPKIQFKSVFGIGLIYHFGVEEVEE